MDKYQYEWDKNNKKLIVYEKGKVMATISDIYSAKKAEEMFAEVVYEMRGIEIKM